MFSVLMSVYYKENPDYLRESLDSVFSQTLPPDEVVLVEDGSLTNELYAVVDEYRKRFPALKIVELPHNMGLGRALNEGLKHCSYEIVARMDSDDICKPDRFEKQIRILTENSEIDILSSWIDEFIDVKDKIVSIRKLPEFHNDIARFAKRRCPLNHPATMFRKDVIMAVGGYKHLYLYEDYYLWARLLNNKATFYNVQESLLWFRSSYDVYKRRGGVKRACAEFIFRKYMWKTGLISFGSFFIETPIRFVIRIMPAFISRFIYQTLLR